MLPLEAKPEAMVTASDYLGQLTERLHHSFHFVRKASDEARQRQKEQYDKRTQLSDYRIGDKVFLDVKVIKDGDSRKFTSKFKGPFRIIKVHNNQTVDIADNSYKIQRVHVNRLKPFYETILWKDDSQELSNEENITNDEVMVQNPLNNTLEM